MDRDDELFSKIIESMGIINYDPLVISALSEYSRSKFVNLKIKFF